MAAFPSKAWGPLPELTVGAPSDFSKLDLARRALWVQALQDRPAISCS